MSRRQLAARDRRIAAAEAAFARPAQEHRNNGEENDFPFIVSYSKGMPHGDDGVVRFDVYLALLRALSTRLWEDFEAIPLGGGDDPRRFTSPQAGLAFDTEGPDPQAIAMPPAPRVGSAEGAAEMIELYWMSLLRDVPFTDYESDPVAAQAAEELTAAAAFTGPREDGRVTPRTLFRGGTHRELPGPFISQFLLRDVPFGTLLTPQRQDAAQPGRDFVTDWESWLRVQNGERQPEPARDHGNRRYVTTGRELSHYVHYDMLHQAYLNAAAILIDMDAVVDFSMPYVDFSRNQDGFATYGPPHIQTLVTEVATRALRAAWYAKWFVHRRMRPEELGGRVHAHRTGTREFPVLHGALLDSSALEASFGRHRSYLLSQAYPEGSPTHPSYSSGHATVAGACATVLKAWFCESFVLPDPVVPDPTGTRLVPNEGSEPLFTGSELNKLAVNIGMGRNFAGIHYRSDLIEGLKLGEAIAIEFLREHLDLTHEKVTLDLTKFDGTGVEV